MIKEKIRNKSLEYLLNKRNTRNGKEMELTYTKLTMQNYFYTEDIDISNQERKFILQLGTKMCF